MLNKGLIRAYLFGGGTWFFIPSAYFGTPGGLAGT